MSQICTERLVIRRFQPDDWLDLYEYLSDSNVVKFEPYEVYSEEECRQAALSRSQSDAFWAVCLRQGGKLIGNIYFEQQQPLDWLTWELGYVFNAAYQGKGYAAESCLAFIDWAVQTMGVRRIVANCNPDNLRSWRLLQNLGFRREGHLRQVGYFKRNASGEPLWHDTYCYAILAEEWSSRDR